MDNNFKFTYHSATLLSWSQKEGFISGRNRKNLCRIHGLYDDELLCIQVRLEDSYMKTSMPSHIHH